MFDIIGCEIKLLLRILESGEKLDLGKDQIL